MDDEGKKDKKIYYSMGEVSEMFDVNPSLLRFWERKFSVLKPAKNKKGNRLFTPQDVENLKLIYHLVKENGMTLAGAQKRLAANRDGLRRDLEIIERLQSIRATLVEVRQELKIDPDDGTVEILVDSGALPADLPAIHPALPEDPAPIVAREPEAVSGSAGVTGVEIPAAVEITPDAVMKPECIRTQESQPDPAPEVTPDAPRMTIVEQTLF